MCRIMAFVGTPYDEEEVAHFYRRDGAVHKDASGIALLEGNTLWSCKSGMRGPAFWHVMAGEVAAKLPRADVGLFHVRTASDGSPTDNANNHPIIVGNAVLIHNGIVRPPRWLEAYGKCDSEQLLRYWLSEGPASWERFTGWGAVILHDDGVTYCNRTPDTPLYWRHSKNGIQLDQTGGRGWMHVPPNVLYKVGWTTLTPVRKLRIKPLPPIRAHRLEADSMISWYRYARLTKPNMLPLLEELNDD